MFYALNELCCIFYCPFYRRTDSLLFLIILIKHWFPSFNQSRKLSELLNLYNMRLMMSPKYLSLIFLPHFDMFCFLFRHIHLISYWKKHKSQSTKEASLTKVHHKLSLFHAPFLFCILLHIFSLSHSLVLLKI